MRNSPGLPVASLILAAVLAAIAAYSAGDGPLTELQLGEIAGATALAIFGIQGLISIAVEGEELHPGRSPALLSSGLGAAIAVLSIALIADAAVLAFSIADEWEVKWIGTLAGIGCIALAMLLAFYKEGYIGDEATFDNRQDGVPW